MKFHGLPKPENCADAWVRNLYKVDAGLATDIKLEYNLDSESIQKNVEANCAHDVPWLKISDAHDGIVAIVGGGPSASDDLPRIRDFADNGVHIWALNGSANWLHGHGITPQRHIVLDARPENASFVNPDHALGYYLASQCDPKLFSLTGDRPVTLFHSYSEETEPFIKNEHGKNLTLVASGSTVGLAGMVIAYAEGFRVAHLFGYDSSYSELGHHAYSQSLNDDEKTIRATVGDRTFTTCAWMASQANEFQYISSELANGGMVIAVHGDGLLPAIAHQMQATHAESDADYKRVGGFLWPSSDMNAAPRVLEDVSDVDDILTFVKDRNVAVQAGGNVGVYPKELGKTFRRVYTFEPDSKNYACMQDNVPEDHVIKYRAALGSQRGYTGLSCDENNCGAHFMVSGNDIQVVAIDDLGLEDCNLIYLDVEGYEMEALKGASDTIRRFRPVIVAEDKGLSERYGVDEGAIVTWLKSEFGYIESGRLGRDVIMTAA